MIPSALPKARAQRSGAAQMNKKLLDSFIYLGIYSLNA